jgi:hypothetical protein
MKIFVFILLILNISNHLALKKSDLCITKSDCNEKNSFKCYDNICAKTRKSCNDFETLMIYTKNSGSLKVYNNMQLFLATIKSCVRKSNDAWKTSDVCLKEDTCFAKEYTPFLKAEFKLTLISNPDECKCGNRHSVLCNDKKYCGINQEACNGLKSSDTIQKCSKYIFLFNIISFI